VAGGYQRMDVTNIQAINPAATTGAPIACQDFSID